MIRGLSTCSGRSVIDNHKQVDRRSNERSGIGKGQSLLNNKYKR